MESHTLYAAPFACSLAVHLVLAQHEIPHTVRWVRLGADRQIADRAYVAVNPKRKVAALALPGGEVLTENAGILLYLDEAHRGPRDPAERRRLIEWLIFLGTELHKQVLAASFDPRVSDEARQDARDRLLPPVLAHLEEALADRPTLLGDPEPSGADAYLFWGLLLLRHLWPDVAGTPALTTFRQNMQARPWVRSVLGREQEARAQAAEAS